MDNDDRSVWVETGKGEKTYCLLPAVGQGEWRYSLSMLDAIARQGGSILITGETGTGKELLARYLHDRSRRASGPYVTVNCTGLTEERMQGELFGWKRGAFTGAGEDYDGLIPRAEGGTLFLDEIGNMDRQNQGRLLRFLQTGEIQPLGKPVQHADVRVIAATNRESNDKGIPDGMIPDLFYRFGFSDLVLPPLRERGADVYRLLVMDGFLGGGYPFTGIAIHTLANMVAHDWPGNIRELRRYCQHARLFAGLLPRDVPPPLHVHYGDFPFGVPAQTLLSCVIEECLRAADRTWNVMRDSRKQKATELGRVVRLVLAIGTGPIEMSFTRQNVIPLDRLVDMLAARGKAAMAFNVAPIDEQMAAGGGHFLFTDRGTALDLIHVLVWIGRCCRELQQHGSCAPTSPDLPRFALENLPDFVDWDDPPPPLERDQDLEARLSALDLSRSRRHPPETITQVLRLWNKGLSRSQIADRLGPVVSSAQVDGLIRTYGSGFEPTRRNRGGRPCKERPALR